MRRPARLGFGRRGGRRTRRVVPGNRVEPGLRSGLPTGGSDRCGEPPRRPAARASRARHRPAGGVQSMTVLEAVDLSKTFGSGEATVAAVSGVSMSVDAGEVLVVRDPSGSGKTTRVSMIGGLLTPTTGRVHIEGVGSLLDSKDLGRVRLRTIGFVFQTFNLLPALNAAENVSLPLRLLGVRRSIAL